MIIDAIVALGFTMANFLLDLFPEIPLPGFVASGIGFVDTVNAYVGQFTDLGALAALMAFIIAGETALFAVRALMSVKQLKLF